MVSNSVIVSMFVPIIFSFALFIGLILFYKKRTGIALKPLIIGSIGFIVLTQVLEKALHVVVVLNFPNYADHPWLFGLYGGMAAGIFEELGRFVLFIWLLKKYHDYKGGLSFGIGWGGIEAIVLMLSVVLPNILFAFMINAGTFEINLGERLSWDEMNVIKETVLSQGISFYLLAGVERFFAVFIQIALSLWVLYAVMKRKFVYVIYAVLTHAAIDFPIVFFQTGHFTNIWVVEGYVALIGVLAMVVIKRLKIRVIGLEG